MKSCTFILFGLTLAFDSDYKRVIAFGDSLSDNGNVFRMTSGFMPNRRDYKDGRFSNGPTWVEYFANSLKANLVNLAYGGATTDRDMYPDSIGSMVPGCIQQAEALTVMSPPDNSTLVTVEFQGNDFFSPNASAQAYMDNMNKCLRIILAKGFKRVLVGTSNAAEIPPLYKVSPPAMQEFFVKNTANLPELWKPVLQSLKKDFKEVTLYSLDFKGIYTDVASGKTLISGKRAIISSEPCLKMGKKCKDVDVHMFWDEVHPTTELHRVIAKYAYALINNSTLIN